MAKKRERQRLPEAGKVCVVGSVNIDLLLSLQRLPHSGETVLAEGMVTQPGGKGANQAAAAARLGATVSLVGRVGEDAFGLQVMEDLRSFGVDTTFVRVDKTMPTGLAVVMVDAMGRNAIAVAPGANAALSPEDVDSAKAAIAGAGVLLVQLEIPLATVERAVALAGRFGVPVVLNPAPARALPEGMLSKVALVVPNEVEALALTGVRVTGPLRAREAAGLLLQQGASAAVLTLGDRGYVARTPAAAWGSPAHRVRVADTTGCGDTFLGALAAFLSGGAPVAEAAELANGAAALAATSLGARAALPDREALMALLSVRDSPS